MTYLAQVNTHVCKNVFICNDRKGSVLLNTMQHNNYYSLLLILKEGFETSEYKDITFFGQIVLVDVFTAQTGC